MSKFLRMEAEWVVVGRMGKNNTTATTKFERGGGGGKGPSWGRRGEEEGGGGKQSSCMCAAKNELIFECMERDSTNCFGPASHENAFSLFVRCLLVIPAHFSPRSKRALKVYVGRGCYYGTPA